MAQQEPAAREIMATFRQKLYGAVVTQIQSTKCLDNWLRVAADDKALSTKVCFINTVNVLSLLLIMRMVMMVISFGCYLRLMMATAYEQASGMWICKKCGADVYLNKAKCYKCGEPRPPHVARVAVDEVAKGAFKVPGAYVSVFEN